MEWLGSDRRAIAIIRVSSDKQTDNYSHETQQTGIDAYCERHGLTLVNSFRITESAKHETNRKLYDAAFAFALKSKIRHVIFYMQDRESRNLTDTERNESLVRKDKIVLHYAHDRKVYWAKSPTSDFMARDYSAVSSKYQIKYMADKVKDALLNKALSGFYPGARPPRGYRTERLRNSRGTLQKSGAILIPCPETAPWIVREFELRAQGLSFEAIRQQCLKEGVVPTKYVKTYHRSSVEYHIKDPIYYGRVRWCGIEYDGKHELIIPPDVLRKVEALGAKKRGRKTFDPRHGIFGNEWIKCECGLSVVYDPKIKKNRATGKLKIYHYYRCSNSNRKHKSLAGRNISEATLWDQFGDAIGRITISTALAKDLATALNRTQEAAKKKAHKEAIGFNARITQLEADEDLAYEHFKKGAIDSDRYRRETEKLRSQKRECIDALESLKTLSFGANSENSQTIIELALNARKIWKKSRSPLHKRMLLERVLSNPILKGLSIEYQLKKPFLILEEMGRGKDWLGYLDDFRTSLSEYRP